YAAAAAVAPAHKAARTHACLADRWESPGTARASCGWYAEPPDLAAGTFQRQNSLVACGLVLDRDVTAASDAAKLAASLSESHDACGEDDGAGRGPRTPVKPPSVNVKQEPTALYGRPIQG